jgi:Tol biopolymer transport system component
MKHLKNYHLLFQIGGKLLTILVCLMIWQTAANGQNLKADYQFQGNFNSSVAGAPGLINISGTASFQLDTVDGYARQTVRFPANAGLSLNTVNVVPNNSYTVVMLFRLDNVTGTRRRVFDAKQGLSDSCGLYVGTNSRLDIETTATTLIYPNTYIQVAIVRDSTGNIRIQRDGFTFTNSTDGSCYLNNDNLRFFRDDMVVPNEASAGNVARIRLYDAPLTAAQVRALDRLPNANGGGDQSLLFHTTRHNFPEIYSMNADGGNQRRLTNNAVADYNARWSPDKSKIVFTRGGTTEQIWIMNADGSGQTQLTNTTNNDHAPSFKPDGSKIVFSRCDASFVCDIYTMNTDGTNQQPFSGATQPAIDEDIASYSPDGTKILFGSIQVNPNIPTSGLYSLTETGFINRLTAPTLPIGDREARYSANGSKIAFARFPDVVTGANPGGIEIYTANADGTNETRITNNAWLDSNPFWSPDGTKLSFHSQRDIAVNEIYTMNAANGGNVERLTFNSAADFLSDWYATPTSVNRTPFDFDGDGRADLSVFRPSNSFWYLNGSQTGFTSAQFGLTFDKLAPADYDGDGKTDIAVWRDEPADIDRANFYILNSSTNTVRIEQFGRTGDDPSVVGDWDGDQKADVAVYRNGVGFEQRSHFYYRPSSQPGVNFVSLQWGVNGDKPMRGDYDGDGKLDAAVFRPIDNVWYIRNSLNGALRSDYWGIASDKFVPADYDGDSKTDLAVVRNGIWYIKQSSNNQARYENFGLSTDVLVPADYDGDGKVDLAVFRDGQWYLSQSTSGFTAQTFGNSTDQPVPRLGN